MEQARWNQIEELLQAALDRPPADRAAFLTAACGGDEALSREVEALLAKESEGSFLEAPAAASLPPRVERVPLTGKRIGHYAIEKWIGAGGMGEVYEARDDRLQRTVALKALPAEFTADAERVARFEQEALAASRLNQPNIITIFEFVHEGDEHCIVTERVEGETLRALMTDAQGKPRKLPAARALDITMQIASALKAAHTAWIIHRDIKPENVMVRSDDLVKVLDFGIAKLNHEPNGGTARPAPTTDPARSDLTVPGAVLGTASYMSPEQARGEPLDGRTDLYSLGLVFAEMLTGTRPPAERALDDIPKEIQRIVRRMLRVERGERYASAAELLDDLARARRRIESRTARRMVGWSVLAIVLALTIAAFAALLSINEVWEERVLRDGHTAAARQAVFSPDGRLLVSCSEDGQIIVWDFARRERATTINGHRAHKIAFSPDGRWLASGGTNGTITIWDARRWTKIRDLRAHRSEIGLLGFSADGTLLASADSTEKTILWSTAQWKHLRSWPMTSSHSSVLFSADGNQFLQANSLTAYDVKSATFVMNDEKIGGNWIASSPDRTRMANVDTFGNLAIYRFASPGDVRNPLLLTRVRAHQDHGRAVAWSPDGRLIASASEDVLLWDAATLQKLARFEHSAIVWSIAFSPDGRHLISAHADGAVLIWDVPGRERIANLNEHSGAVRAVAFAPDGRRVASAGEDRSITVWDSVTGRKEAVLRAHETRVTAVAFAAGGKRLVSSDQDGLLLRWDLASGAHRRLAPPELVPSYFVAMSPDERTIVISAASYASDGRRIANFSRTLAWQYGQPYDGQFSPDGRMFAMVTDRGDVVLLDPATWRITAQYRLPNTHLISVSLSRDRQWLITGEDEGAVRLWSVDPLKPVAVIGRHAARIKAVALSPDGKTAASAADDKTIAIWDVKRRKLRSRAGTHSSPIYAIAFSPDGKRLLSGEHDRSVRIYTQRRSLWGVELE